MSNDTKPQYRPGVHVHIYLWLGLIVVSVVPAFLISGALFDASQFVEGAFAFAVLLASFQALFWYSRRRCSSQELAAWDGLLYITSYMTIGVGTTSLFVAVPAAIVAVLGLIGIAVASVGDEALAREWFQSMVAWFSRHRMYQ